ncbi:MAG: four helix bundle protein [Deltaproteobacteria bacterium]|jgi:four helix bundle protein|nr:four helix bundle protein [Deltaproteobacteria bacterium]MBW2515427.1 four helix bundle protein [Deltaproteobacteria bacterium]
MTDKITSYRDLRVFQNAMNVAMDIFHLSAKFPPEEQFALTGQMRQAARSVCSHISRAWRKRRFKTPFVAKLNDSEGQACETQVWIEFARQCKYLDDDTCEQLNDAYEQIMGQLGKMIGQADKWLIKKQPKQPADSPSN